MEDKTQYRIYYRVYNIVHCKTMTEDFVENVCFCSSFLHANSFPLYQDSSCVSCLCFLVHLTPVHRALASFWNAALAVIPDNSPQTVLQKQRYSQMCYGNREKVKGMVGSINLPGCVLRKPQLR